MNPPSLSVHVLQPLWSSNLYNLDVTDRLDSYSHSIQAVGGYWDASFTIKGDRYLVEEWLAGGLGRHVEVKDDALITVWEGFVNEISITYGPLSLVYGPLMDVANRVSVVYSGIERDEDGNTVVGVRTTSAAANDTDSQGIYGIIPKVLSIGGATEEDAEDIRDTYLEEHKLPKITKALGQGGELTMTISCWGYVRWLNWPYESATTTGTENASTKITNVLGDTPNGAWLACGTDGVDANGLQVPVLEDTDNLAWSVIQDVVARGDGSDNRWLFGIYANREVIYEQAPTTFYYQQRLADSKARVELLTGAEVRPWNVLPGKWLLFHDLLVGTSHPAAAREDPRAMFIETVRFTSPDQLALEGGDSDKLAQVVAQLGLAGIGA